MNKVKRSRPLLLERLEDRSLFAASMMWSVPTDHETQVPVELDDAQVLSEIFSNRYEDLSGFDDLMVTGLSSAGNIPVATMDLRQDWPSVSGSAQTSMVVFPVFQVTFMPTAEVPSAQITNGASVISHTIDTPHSIHARNAPVPQARAATGEAGVPPGPTPATLNSTFASASNLRSQVSAPVRRIEGSPQAAPSIESGHGNVGSASTLSSPTATVQSAPIVRNLSSESNAYDLNNESTILLVTPSGQPLSENARRFEWIPHSPTTNNLADGDDWNLPEPMLRNLRALTRPSHTETPSSPDRLPLWFAERTGMIALSVKTEMPTDDVVDAESVDVVLGAMMGVNRVITVASSMIDEPLKEAGQTELLEAIDEALADQVPLPRASTRLSAMAYPAVAIVASALAVVKRYRSNGRMEHTR